MQMEKTKYVSIGEFCMPSIIIKDVLLAKQESYPFDWVYSDVRTVINCVKDDFSELSKKLLERKNDVVTENLWFGIAHKNIKKDDDLQYYHRTIDRFRDLLNEHTGKVVFLHASYTNKQIYNTELSVERKAKLNELYDTIKEKSKTDFAIVSITFQKGESDYYKISKDGNIYVMEIFTKKEQILNTWIHHVQGHKSVIIPAFKALENEITV
ncbi:hypothetical protein YASMINEVIRUS_1587 [Yasminevirus sp. GU-2018]|uniref:Papain-like cysteine peptidase n=1 Tax=Yasminevirus sp. GU-2018 TaxID=2420051 RepID=A0A5K0UBF9_9VIRU|nr:hypothetical protein YASMINEVIRUS_1587 [Yasminevirus sp. GU-2018]